MSKCAILALVALIGLSLLYTAVLAQPLLPVVVTLTGIVLSFVILYLLWRFVLAIERIADAMD
ncbi:MAG: hypothetical protein IH933_01295 [Euryarchaeota archaeon]|nr:hypothetical protein [Euryarchaeota archaeon]